MLPIKNKMYHIYILVSEALKIWTIWYTGDNFKKYILVLLPYFKHYKIEKALLKCTIKLMEIVYRDT